MPARARTWLRLWTFPLLSLLVAAIAIGAALILVDTTGERLIEEETRTATLVERDYMAAVAREQGLAALVDTLNRRERLRGAGFRYALTDAAGKPLAGGPGFPGDGESNLPANGRWRVELKESGKRTSWQVIAEALPTGERLAVAQSLDRRRAFRKAVFRASGFAILLASAACIAVGLALNGLLLHRARSIAATAERIAGGDLSARVAVSTPGDVFDRLGVSLNLMLSRIDELMTGMRTVTDSLAHDLRMPLTRLKGALARAAHPDADEEERAEALGQANEEAEQALATFSALLDIARAETGLSSEMMREIDLTALAANVAELFAPVFEDHGQTFELVLPYRAMKASIHELLLRQALGNLLHNAMRHAGDGAKVRLTVEEGDGVIRVIVADNGPGVPAEDRGRVQERFVRLDPARSAQGSGLGLAIVAACGKLHGGQLLLEDNHPGLKAILTLRR